MERSNRAKMLSPELKKGKGLSPEMKSFSESNLRETKSSPEIQRRCSTPDFHHIGEQNGVHDEEEMNKEKLSSSIFGRMMSSFTKRSPRNLKSSSGGSADEQFSHSSTNNEDLKDGTNENLSFQPEMKEESKESSKESLLLHFDGEPSCKESNKAEIIDDQVYWASLTICEPVLLPSSETEDATLLHACPAVTTELHLIESNFPPDKEHDAHDESDLSKEVNLSGVLSSSVFLPEMYPTSEHDANYTPEEEDVGLDVDAAADIKSEEESLLATISPTFKAEVDALNPQIKTVDDFAKVQAQVEDATKDVEVYAVDDPTELLSELATDFSLDSAVKMKTPVMLSEDQSAVPTVKYHFKVLAYLSVITMVVLLVSLLHTRYNIIKSNDSHAVMTQPSKAVMPLDVAEPYLMPAIPPVTEVPTTKDNENKKKANKVCREESDAKKEEDGNLRRFFNDKAGDSATVQQTIVANEDAQQRQRVADKEDTTFEALLRHQQTMPDESLQAGRVHPPAVINNQCTKQDSVVMKVLKFPFRLPKLLLQIVNKALRLLFSPFMSTGHNKKVKRNGIMPAARKKEDDEQVLSPLPVELI